MTIEQLLIAIQESIVERDAYLICVESFILLILLKHFSVGLQHVSNLCFKMLRQFLFQEGADLLAMLAVTVGDREEVAVFQATEMRNCDPHILIYLVGIAW